MAQKNPPETRSVTIFGGGLFTLSSANYDALLIQMDSDILDNPMFVSYVFKELQYQVIAAEGASKRAEEIRSVLRIAGRFGDMTERDVQKHVLAPAVESTENWCVAAFTMPPMNFELLSGQELVDAFMIALQRSEGYVPTPPYSQIEKDQGRRQRFCQKYSKFHSRITEGCEQFRLARDELFCLAER